jgi:hypothetical protein
MLKECCFPVWVSKVKYLCTVYFLCDLFSFLNMSSSLLLGLAWKCNFLKCGIIF